VELLDRLSATLSRPILLLTLAPEQPGALAVIAEARNRNMAVSLGHSDARAATIKAAIQQGARFATHLGNGVAHQMHKFDNPIMAQLTEDDLWGCFIMDGIHVPKESLKVLLRAKGLDKSILVTDAVSAAAAKPGRYPFAGMWVDRTEDGTVREKDAPHLAGSSLTMDQGIRNLVNWGLCSFDQAIALGSHHVRQSLNENGISLDDPGEVVWSDDHQVVETRLKGEVVYRKAG
jgi:N-acetylglucosamine-6-phosphate deacetylase